MDTKITILKNDFFCSLFGGWGALFLLFFFPFLCINAQTNLVQNGSFESVDENNNPIGWTYGSTSSVVYSVVTDAYEGSKALQADVSSTSGGIARYILQTVNVEAGAKYNISFWYKVTRDPTNTTDGGVLNIIGWKDISGNTISSLNPDGTPLTYLLDTWLPYTAEEVVAPQGAVNLSLRIAFNRKVKAVIDSVEVIKITDTGIDELSGNAIRFAPNPVIDEFAVKNFSGSGTLTLIDLNGRQLLQQTVDSESFIPVANLPKGIYIVKLTTETQGIKMGKIVKK